MYNMAPPYYSSVDLFINAYARYFILCTYDTTNTTEPYMYATLTLAKCKLLHITHYLYVLARLLRYAMHSVDVF